MLTSKRNSTRTSAANSPSNSIVRSPLRMYRLPSSWKPGRKKGQDHPDGGKAILLAGWGWVEPALLLGLVLLKPHLWAAPLWKFKSHFLAPHKQLAFLEELDSAHPHFTVCWECCQDQVCVFSLPSIALGHLNKIRTNNPTWILT